MTEQTIVAAPHAHGRSSVRLTMVHVLAALLPATGFSLYLFGWPAVMLLLITTTSAITAEALCLALMGRPIWPSVSDGSAAVTGWLLALTLPPWAPWWIGFIGSLLAIVIAKHAFGGLGQNPFNPAMVARVALLISFPVEMASFVEPHPILAEGAPSAVDSIAVTFGAVSQIDGVSSATLLGRIRTELAGGTALQEALSGHYQPLDLVVGTTVGSMGETSAALILIGGAWLMYKRVITWHIPVSMLIALFSAASIVHLVAPTHYPDGLLHVITGGAMLGAFFIATDPVGSPVTPWGQIIFGTGCGLLVYVIRTASAYPEGIGFAVMLMNACTPLIDHYVKPRIAGRDRRGDPLAVPQAVEERS